MPKRANGRSLDSAARSGGRDGPHGVAVEAYPRLRAASSVTTDLEDVAERVRLRHHVVDAVRDTGYLEVLAGDVPGVDVAPSNRDPHRHPRRRWKPRRQVAVREPVGPAVEVR